MPSRPTKIAPLFVMLVACMTVGLHAGPAEDYRDSIRPLLEAKCYPCHGPEKQKADLNLSAFGDFQSIEAAPEIWQSVLERVQAFEMPPKNAPELNFGQQQKLMEFLRQLPKPEKPDCTQLASDRTANFYRGYVMSRRLNRAEYLNTLRDLLGVSPPIAGLLPADGGGGEGFDTTGSALFTSSIHIEKYLAAADQAIDFVLPDRARGLPKDRARARAALLVAKPGWFTPARDAARTTLTAFAARAFRRPTTPDEIDRLLALFDRASQRGDSYVASLRLAMKAVLVSPHFLFLAEPEPATGGIHPLGPFPLASRLSYFLWSSMPDDELLALAASGDLMNTNVYRQQVRRMLQDPRAEALGERFAVQWLDLERLGGDVRPDPARFPEFDPQLNQSMLLEVTTYFNHLIRNNRPLLDLIDSDYTFVNTRLARLYGIEHPPGNTLQKVTLTDRNRGGLLGMAAIHAVTAYPLRTSPVLRGRWVLEALLGDKVPPPPPEVQPLEESKASTASLSLRQQLEVHRANAECAACHDKMDPLGFGLENFDNLGRWRDTDRGLPLDATGTLPSGETYSGPAGLKQVLLGRKDKILRHLARKMTGFAFGRELNRFDDCVVDRAMEALHQNGYLAWTLLEEIAVSFPFRHRFYPKQES